METYPLLVGFSFAVGAGLIAHAALSFLYSLVRRMTRGVSGRPSRLSRLMETGTYEKRPVVPRTCLD